MIQVPLTKGKFAIIDDENSHLLDWSWYFSWNGYAVRKERENDEQCPAYLHHAVIGKPIGKLVVDHINRNRLDNRRNNLRIVTQKINVRNKELSGGYTKKGDKWQSQIKINGKKKYLGLFKTKEMANAAYKNALKEYWK